MKNITLIAALCAVIAMSAGCCNCRSYQRKTNRPLEGTSWQLVQLGGQSIKPIEGRYSLTFNAEDKQIAGLGDCNRLMGSYTLGEQRAIKIGPLASTMRACEDGVTEREFTRAIESTTHYEMDGPMLMLLSNGDLKLVFQAATPAPER